MARRKERKDTNIVDPHSGKIIVPGGGCLQTIAGVIVVVFLLALIYNGIQSGELIDYILEIGASVILALFLLPPLIAKLRGNTYMFKSRNDTATLFALMVIMGVVAFALTFIIK